MPDNEHTIQRAIFLALNRGRTRIFRYNSGVAWQGEHEVRKLPSGDTVLVLRNFRRVELGEKGMPDLIGWKRLESGVAQFVGIEVKSPGKKPTATQRRTMEMIKSAGGCVGWADSVEKAKEIVS